MYQLAWTKLISCTPVSIRYLAFFPSPCNGVAESIPDRLLHAWQAFLITLQGHRNNSRPHDRPCWNNSNTFCSKRIYCKKMCKNLWHFSMQHINLSSHLLNATTLLKWSICVTRSTYVLPFIVHTWHLMPPGITLYDEQMHHITSLHVRSTGLHVSVSTSTATTTPHQSVQICTVLVEDL